jgi:hypothetical protein
MDLEEPDLTKARSPTKSAKANRKVGNKRPRQKSAEDSGDEALENLPRNTETGPGTCPTAAGEDERSQPTLLLKQRGNVGACLGDMVENTVEGTCARTLTIYPALQGIDRVRPQMSPRSRRNESPSSLFFPCWHQGVHHK